MGPYAVGILAGAVLGAMIPACGHRALIALAGASIVLIAFWRPYAGFLLLIASLPADVLGVIDGAGSSLVLSVTKILGAITVAAAAFDVLRRRRSLKLRRLWSSPTAAAGLFAAATALAFVAHPSEDGRIEILRLATILGFVLVTMYFVDRPSALEQVVWVLVGTATLAAAQAVAQRFGGIASVSDEWAAQAGAVLDVGEEAAGAVVRTSGSFSHPAWLGLFLSMTVPLTLYVLWTANRRTVTLAAAGSLVIQLAGVFSTYSRMAYIGVAAGIALFAMRRRFGPAAVAALVFLGAAAFPLLPDAVRWRVRSIVEYRESSSSMSRIGQQMAAAFMFRDHPLTGIGPGNYESRTGAYAPRIPERYEVQAIGAHNMYAEVAAELGAPGLAALLLLLGVTWRRVRRLRCQALRSGNRRAALLFECLGISLIVFVVSAAFVHAQSRKEWWLVVALIAAAGTFPAPQSSPTPSPEAAR